MTPKVSEWALVLAFLIGALLFNLRSFNEYPTAWADEVLWSEPAINLIKTGHFTTSVWQFQKAGSFWAAQSPLYCFGVAAWMKMVGTDLQAARSFNLALITVAVFLAWILSWRARLIARAGLRILLPILLLTGYGTSFAYRCSRPDIAGMICLLSIALAFYVEVRSWRFGMLFMAAVAAPWIGIQVALFTAITCGLAFLFFPSRQMWADCIVVAAGMLLGTFSMLAFFLANGVLGDLLVSVTQAANELQHWNGGGTYWTSIPWRIGQSFDAFTKDLSVACLIMGVVPMLLSRWRSGGSLEKYQDRDLTLICAVVIIIPFAFSFTAHFAFYYEYMIYVPLSLAFLALWDRTFQPFALRPSWQSFACAVIATGACFLGLPLRLAVTWNFCEISPRHEYTHLISSALEPDDVIFADYPAFFECKSVAHRVYSPMYSRHFLNLSSTGQDFTREEKQEVTVLAIPVAKLAEMEKYWGGKWVAVTPPFGDSMLLNPRLEVPFLAKKLRSYLSNSQSARTPFQLFRRVPGSTDSASTAEPTTFVQE